MCRLRNDPEHFHLLKYNFLKCSLNLDIDVAMVDSDGVVSDLSRFKICICEWMHVSIEIVCNFSRFASERFRVLFK